MDQKTVFYQLFKEDIISVEGKFQDKYCVNQESYDQIQAVLTSGKGEKCQLGPISNFGAKRTIDWRIMAH